MAIVDLQWVWTFTFWLEIHNYMPKNKSHCKTFSTWYFIHTMDCISARDRCCFIQMTVIRLRNIMHYHKQCYLVIQWTLTDISTTDLKTAVIYKNAVWYFLNAETPTRKNNFVSNLAILNFIYFYYPGFQNPQMLATRIQYLIQILQVSTQQCCGNTC